MPPSTDAADASSKPEKKTNKKVSRACNTCRLKRTKCDGQDPCFFCVDTHNECSYSREPRRRGPPSGYLRYIETRVIILETFLGLLISRSPSLSPTLTPLAHHLHGDSKPSSGVTQDVWDDYREHWTKEVSCRVLEDTVVGVTGFVRKEEEGDSSTATSGLSSGFKPLLPPKGGDDGTGISISAKAGKKSVIVTTQQPQSRTYSSLPRPPSPPSLYFHPQSKSVAPTESFERTAIRSSPAPSATTSIDPRSHFQHHDALNFTHSQKPTYEHTSPSSSSRLGIGSAPEGWLDSLSNHAHDPEHMSFMDNFSFGADGHSIAGPSEENMDTRGHLQGGADARTPDLPSVLPQAEDGNSSYTGSYWRTATALLDHQNPPTSISQITDQTDLNVIMHTDIDLPPAHIMSHLLDVHYNYVHPIFPFLPDRDVVDDLGKSASATSSKSTHVTGGDMALLLAICGYAGQLSSSSDIAFTPSATKPSTILGGGIANKIAADLWYEQARSLVMNHLRRAGSSLESVQTLLLCALRDQGKGRESQAWLLFGLAVRMGQDLGLHLDSTDDGMGKEQAQTRYSAGELAMRRRVWGVTLVLDLYISLQLGRPPAAMDGNTLFDPSSSTPSVVTGTLAFTLNHNVDADHLLFAYTVSLSRIISRINLYLYLAISGHPNSKTTRPPNASSEMLKALESELDTWHQSLPAQFRISIGHQPTREVIELNMLYHVAIILLYRPFCKDRVRQATEVCLEAASTFNVLLSKYRSTHPLPLSNPHLIYLIYTVAIAHLSGYRQLQDVSMTTSLQTQLHLINCLEAFKMVGQTWDLAGRCWRALNRLMDVEDMKPGGGDNPAGSTLGKRKRRDTPFDVGQQQQKRDSSLSMTTPSTLQDTSTALTSPSISGGSNQDVFSSWPSSVSMTSLALTQSSSVPATTTSTDMLFDPDFFSFNTGWMPDVHMDGSFGEMWTTSDWDDNFWAKRLQTPVNIGVMDRNFVMGQNAGDLSPSFVQP